MIDKQYLKSEIIDMDLYDFFEVLGKANINEVLVIKQVLETGRQDMLKIAEGHKTKAFSYTEESFNQSEFDNEITYMVQCFAMAVYLDKKLDLCKRVEQDLTPACFKKDAPLN